jgi:hypothetical protein
VTHDEDLQHGARHAGYLGLEVSLIEAGYCEEKARATGPFSLVGPKAKRPRRMGGRDEGVLWGVYAEIGRIGMLYNGLVPVTDLEGKPRWQRLISLKRRRR